MRCSTDEHSKHWAVASSSVRGRNARNCQEAPPGPAVSTRYSGSRHRSKIRAQRPLGVYAVVRIHPRWRGNGTSERHRGHAPLALVLSDRRGDLGRDRGGGRFRVRIGSRNGDHFCRRRCRICRRKLRLLPCQGDTTDQMVSARKLKKAASAETLHTITEFLDPVSDKEAARHTDAAGLAPNTSRSVARRAFVDVDQSGLRRFHTLSERHGVPTALVPPLGVRVRSPAGAGLRPAPAGTLAHQCVTEISSFRVPSGSTSRMRPTPGT